jgi:thiamine transport system ATP-binding protein
VQTGTLEEVWRHPADAETAQFLGYAAVVTGPAAEPLLGVAGRRAEAIALRRSALQVAVDGPLSGVVRSARLSSGENRLVVDVDGIGTSDAVAGVDVALRAGERVRLRLDVSRVAFLDGGRGSAGDRTHAGQGHNRGRHARRTP